MKNKTIHTTKCHHPKKVKASIKLEATPQGPMATQSHEQLTAKVEYKLSTQHAQFIYTNAVKCFNDKNYWETVELLTPPLDDKATHKQDKASLTPLFMEAQHNLTKTKTQELDLSHSQTPKEPLKHPPIPHKIQSLTFTYEHESNKHSQNPLPSIASIKNTKPIFTESTYNKALICSDPQTTIAILEASIKSSPLDAVIDKVAIQCCELLGNAYHKLYQITKNKQDLINALYYLEFTLENAHIYKHTIGYATINNIDSAALLLKEITIKEEIYKQAAELINSEIEPTQGKLFNLEELEELLGVNI